MAARKQYQAVPESTVIQTRNLEAGFRRITAGQNFKEVVNRSDSGRGQVVVKAESRPIPRSLRKMGTGGTFPSNSNPRVNFLQPQIKDPLLSASNFQMPSDRVMMNTWIRYFDRFHPIIGNAIDMHATVPFSKFQLKDIDDPAIRRFYEDMCTEINLFRRILEVSREYELIGECFPFAYWDEEMNAFSSIVILNPDTVEVMGVYHSGEKTWRYELVPDPTILQFLRSENPLDWELVQEIDPAILRAAQTGTNAPLDPFNLSHLARKQSPYDDRGTSIVMGCIKDLLYEEQLLEAQYAISGGIVRPREIWKIGIPGEYTPTDQDIEEFRDMLGAGEYDPNFAIVTHMGVEVDFVGAERRILPIIPEREQIEQRLLTRMYTNKAVTHGEGPTYSNASVAMQFMAARYATKRDLVTEWVRDKIFLPTALANEFYKKPAGWRADDPKELVIPDFQWLSLVDLTDTGSKIQYAMQLATQARLPMKTVLDLLQIDSSEVEYWLEHEEGTRLDPIYQSTRKLSAEAKASVDLKSQALAPGSSPAAKNDGIVKDINVMPGAGGGGAAGGKPTAPKKPKKTPQMTPQTESKSTSTETTQSGGQTTGAIFSDQKKKEGENITSGQEFLTGSPSDLRELFKKGPPDEPPTP